MISPPGTPLFPNHVVITFCNQVARTLPYHQNDVTIIQSPWQSEHQVPHKERWKTMQTAIKQLRGAEKLRQKNAVPMLYVPLFSCSLLNFCLLLCVLLKFFLVEPQETVPEECCSYPGSAMDHGPVTIAHLGGKHASSSWSTENYRSNRRNLLWNITQNDHLRACRSSTNKGLW